MELNEDLRKKLNTWTDILAPLVNSSEWDNIFRFLMAESKKGKVICPANKDLLKSFALCNRHKMKAIIIMQDPYPTFRQGVMIADGIPLSCSYTKYHQPSLYNFWQEIEHTYGFHPDNDLRNDLSYLLEEEHVMLINAALTTEKDKSGSHQSLWIPVMEFWLKEIVNKLYSGLPIVICGQSAWKLEPFIDQAVHHIKKVEHPVMGSRNDRRWKCDDLFNWCNQIIEANNGKSECIQWLRKKEETEQQRALREWLGDDIPSAQELNLPWTD